MARRQTRARNGRKTTRRPRRSGGQRLTLGGPNSTVNPGVTIKQTVTFDLADTQLAIGFAASAVPLSMSIYAIPPRDTESGVIDQQNSLATVRCELAGVNMPTETRVPLQINKTVLIYNGSPKLVQRINFMRLFQAGLQLPVMNVNNTDFYAPVYLNLNDDLGMSWPGGSISIYVVFEYALELSYNSLLSTFPATGATTATAAVVTDVDIRPSKILSNNSSAGYRLRAVNPVLPAVVTLSKAIIPPGLKLARPLTAGAAEAHLDHE